MPGKERVHHRELFGPWLLRQIDSNQFEGVRWMDESKTCFRIPWKHLNRKVKDEQDYGIFKAWAIESGKYDGCDPTTWKTNFRCALNGVIFKDMKMFSELFDHSQHQQDPHKIYRVNCVRAVPLTPAFRADASAGYVTSNLPSATSNVIDTLAHPSSASNSPSTSPAGTFLINALENEEILRISPDNIDVVPFKVSKILEMEKTEFEAQLEDFFAVLQFDGDTEINGYQNYHSHIGPIANEHLTNGEISAVSNTAAVNCSEIPVKELENQGAQYVQHSNGYSQDGLVDLFHFSACQSWTNQAVMMVNNSSKESLPLPHQPSITQSPAGAQHYIYNIQQNGYPHVDSVFKPFFENAYQCNNEQWRNCPIEEPVPTVTNGFGTYCEKPQASEAIPSHSQNHHVFHNLQNGYPKEMPLVSKGFISNSHDISQATNESWGYSNTRQPNPPHNDFGTHSHESQTSQSADAISAEQKNPKLTSWEVTIIYKGKEVHQQTVNQKFLINNGWTDLDLEPVDIVHFPSTNQLVDQTQIHYTDTILESVGGGLLLEVNTTDYKLYAKRLGKTRVYCAMSEDLEKITKETQESKLLPRNVATEIFDFNTFSKELNAYKAHQRPSPDYTIYLCFGQSLLKPKERKLVLVKLVCKFCSYYHEAFKRDGASSLINEFVSLQISNGNSLEIPCLMEIDLASFV